MENQANKTIRGDKMKIENKVSLDELVAAYSDIVTADAKYKSISSKDIKEYTDEIARCREVINKSEVELASATPSEYDINNFEKLIDAINESGKYHFNMSTFFYEGDGSIYERNGSIRPSRHRVGYVAENILNTDNKSFKCNSGACIAGFASAIALDWDTSKTAFTEQVSNYEHWQHIACHFLNIPHAVGTRIFFADGGSIWSYLKPRINFFSSLEWGEDCDYEVDYGSIDEYEYEDLSVSLSSIDYQHAVKALTMIKKGELSFDKDSNPFLTDLCVEWVKE